ncbi:type II secretion system protein [Sulfurimonas sp.]
MRTSKNAFTMIELVFVIVILGILASIAIPKLAATRTDAQISKGRADISSVRSGIMTERQTRLITGISDWIPTGTGTYIKNGTTYNQLNKGGLFGGVLTYPITDSVADGHWHKVSEDVNQTKYTYKIGTNNCNFTYTVADGKFALDTAQPAICDKLVN